MSIVLVIFWIAAVSHFSCGTNVLTQTLWTWLPTVTTWDNLTSTHNTGEESWHALFFTSR